VLDFANLRATIVEYFFVDTQWNVLKNSICLLKNGHLIALSVTFLHIDIKSLGRMLLNELGHEKR
jgi:hypothetical protein